MNFFGYVGLRDTFQKRTASKPIEIGLYIDVINVQKIIINVNKRVY